MIQHSADQTLKMRSCEELIKAAALTAASNGSWQGGRKQKTRKIQSKSSKTTTTRSHLEQTNNSTSLTYPWIYHYTTEHENGVIIRENSAYHERLRIRPGKFRRDIVKEGRMDRNLKGGVKERKVLKFMPKSLKNFVFLFDHYNFL